MSLFGNLFTGGAQPQPMNPPTQSGTETPVGATQTPVSSSAMLEGKFGPGGTQPPAGVKPAEGDAAAAEGKSPLEPYAKLWETPAVDPSKPADAGMFANIDPTKIMESAKNVDFTKFVAADVMSKISAGGPEAQAAFQEAMKAVSSGVFGQSAVMAAQLIKKGQEETKKQVLAELPQMFKTLGLSERLSEKNPVLSDPAVKPIVNALQAQLATKFPEASTADLQKHAETYLLGLANDLVKAQGGGGTDGSGKTPNAAGGMGEQKETDWSKYIPQLFSQ